MYPRDKITTNIFIAFFLKTPPNTEKHLEAFFFTQHGTEPEAQYSLRHPDPTSPQARNTYAAGLFDAHNPDVLYAEVLAKPAWTQPSLSAEEIRRNGGIPPPPQPIFPTEFAIQLYNPEQQVIIRQQTSKWTGTVTYEFCMPQTSFRTPSASNLDRRQDDPVADTVTPMINFVWRKEGRIGKDMTCYLTGKSTDRTGKKAKKNKEPDIAVAMFSGLKEMTIMEPHLYRVDVEDFKGLEVVLLLGAAAIRDIFFHNPNESFHIGDARKNSLGLRGRKSSSPTAVSNVVPPVLTPQPLRQSPTLIQGAFPPARQAGVSGLYAQPSRNDVKRHTLPPIQTTPPPQPQPQPTPHFDPRTQWEIDNETARLKAQVEADRRKQEAAALKARRRAEEEEARKTRQFLENEERQRKQEEKERRRRQAEVDKETERLRRHFGDQRNLFPPGDTARPQQPQRYSAPLLQQPFSAQQRPPVQPPRHTQPGPYLQVPPGSYNAQGPPMTSQTSFFSSSSSGRPPAQPVQSQRPPKARKSFFGLRSASDQSTTTLRKKQSSMF